jgi:hypothetical protein
MHARAFLVTAIGLITSVSTVRGGEPITPPPAELLRFMRSADQIFVFPNPTPRKPRREDKRIRLLPPDARRELMSLIGHQRDWYDGWDNRFDPGGPPPKDINLLFRRGRDELILFFYPGEVIDARFNGRRQPFRWSFGPASYEGIERWKARYAQRELSAQ